MNPAAAPAVRSALPAPTPCQACGVSLFECWRFRDDDQFCSLCGLNILNLHVREEAPAPDGRLWIYQRRGRLPGLTLIWRRQAAGGTSSLTLRPRLDFRRCRARFRHPNLGDITFELREVPPEGDDGQELRVALSPVGFRFEELPIPAAGLEGEVRFAWGVREETRKALLLPSLAGKVKCSCADPTNRPVDGALQVYQRGKSVAVPMEIRSEVPIWLLEMGGGGADGRPDVTVKSDGLPCSLRPPALHRFALQMQTSNWVPRQPVAFAVVLHVHGGLTPLRFDGKVVLVEGEELSFGQSDVWEGEIPLGRLCHPSFLLTASESTAAPGITIADHCILYEGEAEGWLRVLSPGPWPCVVPPRGQGDPLPLRLEVDTTRLERSQFDATLQQACVELRDTRHRSWTCWVRLTLHRPKRLNQYLAIDWGTTNSCAAYRGSDREPPQAVLFHPDQQSAEQFPSDIYFKDISDPDNPIFFIGFQARQFAQTHPECCLHSLKRRFQFQDEVFAMDEQRRTYRYKLEHLVTLILLRLVAMTEETLGREVIKLGVTFPSKWLPRARQRLKRVAEEVGRRMQTQRSGEQVIVKPPEIDEANAVALQVVLRLNQETPLPQSFHMIAYDFGGGTVDTALLHVEYLSASRKLATHYVGIGGRSDFGGDDVTRAVLVLLHQRLPRALRALTLSLDAGRTQTVQLLDIPLIRDGTPPSADTDEDFRKGRTNWDIFWKAAEGIKIDLCRLESPVTAAPLESGTASTIGALNEENSAAPPMALPMPSDPTLHLIGQRLEPYYHDISCRILYPSGEERLVPLDHLLRYLPGDDLDQFRQDLRFTLEDVYEVEIIPGDDSRGGQPFRVSQRLNDTIWELRCQCDERKVEPYLIVLAGGGCGLPLVSTLFRKYFLDANAQGGPILEFNRSFSKQRIAHGMAGYLFLSQFARLEALARSVEMLHHHLGLLQLDWSNGLQSRFRTIAAVGTRINDATTWHRFSFDMPIDGQRLPLFLQDWREGPQPFGYVAFDQVNPILPGDAVCEKGPLPSADSYEGELRLRGPECLEVCVTIQGRRYGPFRVVPTVSDPEDALQG